MIRIVLSIIGLSVCFLPASSLADGTIDALKEFDLFGTWSPDCGKDPTKETASRVNYKISATGIATYETIIRFANGRTMSSTNDIVQAAVLSDNKIKIVIRPVKMVLSIGEAAPPFFLRAQEIVMERVGTTIRALSNHSVDGKTAFLDNGKTPNGESAPVLLKCEGPAN